MSPHVDHLFDRGLISFRRTGQILRSPLLVEDVMKKWHLDSVTSVGPFSSEQDSFLEYHRDVVLRVS
jgi:capsule polysaccharide export protein KpsE/RkpR